MANNNLLLPNNYHVYAKSIELENTDASMPKPIGLWQVTGEVRPQLNNLGPLALVSDIVTPPSLKGDKGDQGSKGDVGPKGEIGDKGDQGIQGVQGVTGVKGEAGQTAAKGDKGDLGNQGTQGIKGDKGSSTITSDSNPQTNYLVAYADASGNRKTPNAPVNISYPINVTCPAITSGNLTTLNLNGAVNGIGRVVAGIYNTSATNSSAAVFLGKPIISGTSLSWEFGVDNTVNNTDNFYIRHNIGTTTPFNIDSANVTNIMGLNVASSATIPVTISSSSASICSLKIGTTSLATNRGSIKLGRSSVWELGTDNNVSNTDDFYIYRNGTSAVVISGSDQVVKANYGVSSSRYDIVSNATNPGASNTLWLNPTDTLRPTFGPNKLALFSDISYVTQLAIVANGYTAITPPSVYTYMQVTICGGGGGGGRGGSSVGGGGGASGTAYTFRETFASGSTYWVSVGLGGAGGYDTLTQGFTGDITKFGIISNAVSQELVRVAGGLGGVAGNATSYYGWGANGYQPGGGGGSKSTEPTPPGPGVTSQISPTGVTFSAQAKPGSNTGSGVGWNAVNSSLNNVPQNTYAGGGGGGSMGGIGASYGYAGTNGIFGCGGGGGAGGPTTTNGRGGGTGYCRIIFY